MVVAKVARVASGKKMVTWIGLIVTTMSGACIALGMEWIESYLPFMRVVCSISLLGGAILTALGKGLADRREDGGKEGV